MTTAQNLVKFLGSRAIVIGGSIAGLLTARVLADYFEKVIIVDRDALPKTPQPRIGVPQSVQPHVLFTKGYQIIDELFPGIKKQLTANGAITIDWTQEFKHYIEGNWGLVTQQPSEIVSVTCSRYLLEWTIRQELLKLPQISFKEQSKVTGLVYDDNSDRITGISLYSSVDLDADLIVDASGRSSQASQWLQAINLNPVPETIVNPFLGYATRRYKLPNIDTDWKVLLISQTPPKNTRLGYLAKIENGEAIATLGGYSKDFPPLDEAGFLKFASSLAQPEFYQTIVDATPTSPIYAHRATANRLRNYEKIKLPLGFVALGDAVCALCPVYGQGMTIAALGAKTLQSWLNNSSLKQLNNNRFQKQLAKNNSFHWMLATSQDARFPATVGGKQGKKGIVDKLMSYMNKLLSKSTIDSQTHLLLLEVSHLLRSPLFLYHPAVIWRVLT